MTGKGWTAGDRDGALELRLIEVEGIRGEWPALPLLRGLAVALVWPFSRAKRLGVIVGALSELALPVDKAVILRRLTLLGGLMAASC